MSNFYGNRKLVDTLKREFNLDNSSEWNKFVQRRGYNILKYGFLKPLDIKNVEVDYINFRKITSYISELSIVLLKYILISERRLTFSLIDIFGDNNCNWQDPNSYDFDSSASKLSKKDRLKRKAINNFISKTQSRIDYNDERFITELNKYGYVNLWTISEKFTFGNIKVFWEITNTDFKKKWISKYFILDNTANRSIIDNFENTIFYNSKDKNKYKTYDLIGLFDLGLNMLNKYRNTCAHNESLLNLNFNLIDLICILNIFLTTKEVNELVRDCKNLMNKYLNKNELFDQLTIKKKNQISVDIELLEKYKEQKFITRW